MHRDFELIVLKSEPKEIFIHKSLAEEYTLWIELSKVGLVEYCDSFEKTTLDPMTFADEVMPFQYVAISYSEYYGNWVIDPNVQMGCQVALEETLDRSINKRMMKLKKKISDLNDQVLKLQAECPHARVKETNRADTGNYSYSDDRYWIEFRCHDCGKWWSEDQ